MITYVKGDVLTPIGSGNKIIIHCCNDIRKWGKGIVVSISKKWKEPELYFKKHQNMTLGTVDFIKVEPDVWIGNMIGQHTIWNDKDGNPPIRYGAIKSCLQKVRDFAIKNKATVHAPKFGAGLAGGKWEKIEELIKNELSDIDVTVYSL